MCYYTVFRHFDEQAFQNDLAQIPWLVLEAADDAWFMLKKLFTPVCNKHAPLITIRVKGRNPEWINDDYISMIHERNYHYSKAHKTNCAREWRKAIKQLRNRCNNLCNSLKREYYDEVISKNKNDSRSLWKTLKPLLP